MSNAKCHTRPYVAVRVGVTARPAAWQRGPLLRWKSMKTKDIRLRGAPDQAAYARCQACSVCDPGGTGGMLRIYSIAALFGRNVSGATSQRRRVAATVRSLRSTI